MYGLLGRFGALPQSPLPLLCLITALLLIEYLNLFGRSQAGKNRFIYVASYIFVFSF